MKNFLLFAHLSCAAICSAQVINGSFESPNVVATLDDGTGLYLYTRNSTVATGWTMSGSQWIWIGSRAPFWVAADGNQYTEVESGFSGAISQSLATVAGQQYTLSFSYAANPFVAAGNADDSMRVSFGGSFVDLIDGTDTTQNDLNWMTKSYVVTATSSSSILQFEDGFVGQPFHGGFLDNVSVVPVPEPGTFAVLGLGAAALLRRRRP